MLTVRNCAIIFENKRYFDQTVNHNKPDGSYWPMSFARGTEENSATRGHHKNKVSLYMRHPTSFFWFYENKTFN